MHMLLVRNSENPEALDASVMLQAYLSSQGIKSETIDTIECDDYVAPACDMCVALGGDGTILRTAKLMGISGTPILGINYGHLGFLANDNDAGVVATVAAALAGDTTREERANMRIEVMCEGDDEAAFDARCTAPARYDGERCFFGLNEAAFTRGASGRMVQCDLSIAGSPIAKMRGDGLITSTATGSTAYALSAGGPLVAPGFRGLVTVPVAPHSLNARAIVCDPNDVVEVEVDNAEGSYEAELFVDGIAARFDAPIAKLRISRGAAPTVLLRYKREGFYGLVSTVFF